MSSLYNGIPLFFSLQLKHLHSQEPDRLLALITIMHLVYQTRCLPMPFTHASSLSESLEQTRLVVKKRLNHVSKVSRGLGYA